MLPGTNADGADVVRRKVDASLGGLDLRDRDGQSLLDLRWGALEIRDGEAGDGMYERLFAGMAGKETV